MPADTSTRPKPFCFVLRPFADKFNDIYKIGIKEACERAGAYCERVDEQIYHTNTLERVFHQIDKADIVIAEMTGQNPNVFYEVGYSHALGKVTVLLTNDANDIPFDLQHFPHVVYRDITGLRDDLAKRVRHYVKNPPESSTDTEFPIDVYHDRTHLTSGLNLAKFIPGRPLEFTLYNRTPRVIEMGEISIGIIGGDEEMFEELNMASRAFRIVRLPDGKTMHVSHTSPRILPFGFAAFSFTVSRREIETNDFVDYTICIFTTSGRRDFAIEVQS